METYPARKAAMAALASMILMTYEGALPSARNEEPISLCRGGTFARKHSLLTWRTA
ncbi:hypothetical protein [Caenimonas soli]|uniref:hypothetical protein n=1 Tax=Caenimonas soli TaxID=2735555 RepID=UPI0038B2BF1D